MCHTTRVHFTINTSLIAINARTRACLEMHINLSVKMLHKVYHMMQISIFFIFRRNLSAFEYDDFPALTSTVKPHSNMSKRSPGNHQSHFFKLFKYQHSSCKEKERWQASSGPARQSGIQLYSTQVAGSTANKDEWTRKLTTTTTNTTSPCCHGDRQN